MDTEPEINMILSGKFTHLFVANFMESVMKTLCGMFLVFLFLPVSAGAVTLVTTSDPGYYNDSIGTILDGTDGGETGPFPVSNDANLSFPTAPDLSAAASILGNWLTDPGNLNSNWSLETSIPNSWPVGEEVAIIYEFVTGGATNVVASFGVDNGIFAWLDGVYLGGERRAGGVLLGEHIFPAFDLTPGTHYLQLLLEDHGVTNGYEVSITADTFLPPAAVPVPAAAWLFGTALIGFVGISRRRKVA